MKKEKKASDLHRTATTTYLCCVPTLEESAGAGRVGLAGCKYTTISKMCKPIANIKYRCILPYYYNKPNENI